MWLYVLDLSMGADRAGSPNSGRVGEDWAIVASYSTPAPDRFVRRMSTFVRNDDGTWRRDDEEHVNTLIDTAGLPSLLAEHGVDATVSDSIGTYQLPGGLMAVVGRKAAAS